ncbi:MAG: hypothetical protein EP334_10545 [Gammaproteobacteria bacterium]|nr:MAG: hypothetical protein EP334_10545 [Gammaproteobacteria bacterium]
MKKFALITLITSSLALAAAPTFARDYDHDRQFSSNHYRYERHNDHDYRGDHHRYQRYDRRDYKRHYHNHHDKHHYRYYRCGYHPGYKGHHSHNHYYDSRTGEYLAIIGGTILITELLRGHH